MNELVNEQIAIQNVLREKLGELQRKNPKFSLRAYSKKVGVHAGALSYILNGKRNVSRSLAERITRRLLLDPQQRSEILRLFPEKPHRRKAGTPEEKIETQYLELSAAQHKVAAEWEHFAVMSLANCQDFQSSSSWIASRLGITEPRAMQVVDRLIQTGIFKMDSDGRITRSKKAYRTTDDVADISMKKHHDQSLDLAKDSLYRDPVSDRDFTTVTMAINPKKFSAAKETIRKFQDDLSELLESGDQTEVYRLSVHLFPLTRLKNGV